MKRAIFWGLLALAALVGGCKDRGVPPSPPADPAPFIDLSPLGEGLKAGLGQAAAKYLDKVDDLVNQVKAEMPKTADAAVQGIESAVKEAEAKAAKKARGRDR